MSFEWKKALGNLPLFFDCVGTVFAEKNFDA
jgi:hypothetical protein